MSLRKDPDGRHVPGSLASSVAAELTRPPAWADALIEGSDPRTTPRSFTATTSSTDLTVTLQA